MSPSGAPDFAVKGSGTRMGGGPQQFGVDAERVPALLKALASTPARNPWPPLETHFGITVEDDEVFETPGTLSDLVEAKVIRAELPATTPRSQ